MFNIIKSITLSYLALSTMVGATSPGTPHLNSRHLFIIKDHPISEKVISEMRNGMAVRKASAGPDMSDEEVLGRILSIAGWDQVNELQPADQNNKAESDRQQEVDCKDISDSFPLLFPS